MDYEFLIPIAFFVLIYAIIKVLSDNKVRQRLIERGQIDENVKLLFAPHTEARHLTNLKWGMVSLAIGLALLIDSFLYSLNDTAKVGIVLIFAGVAFLIYYQKAKQYIEKNEQKSEEK